MTRRVISPLGVSASLHVAVIGVAALCVTGVDVETPRATLAVSAPAVAIELDEPRAVDEPTTDLPTREVIDDIPRTVVAAVSETSLSAWEAPTPPSGTISVPGPGANVRFRAARRAVSSSAVMSSAGTSNAGPARPRVSARPTAAVSPPVWTDAVESSDNAIPEYPPLARRRGLEGVVEVELSVNTDGLVTAATVRDGSGHELLDAAALRAARAWTFEPARVDDTAVATTIRRRLRFTLR